MARNDSRSPGPNHENKQNDWFRRFIFPVLGSLNIVAIRELRFL